MKHFGETDYEKKVIRINKNKAKKVGPGELLDTIVHEETHKGNPNLKENSIRKKAMKKIQHMTPKQKSKMYGKYN